MHYWPHFESLLDCYCHYEQTEFFLSFQSQDEREVTPLLGRQSYKMKCVSGSLGKTPLIISSTQSSTNVLRKLPKLSVKRWMTRPGQHIYTTV